MNEIPQTLPRARSRSELITREIAGELLIYDRNSDEAHCLNSTAALVWTNCDGQTTIAETARLLEAELKTPVADEIVWCALDQLQKSSLLEERWSRPGKLQQVTRRALVKRLGIAVAVTLPLVTSIVAPAAVAAASCGPTGTPCTSNAQCCSNGCVDNGRGGFECT